ncbi:MAG: thioredoxin fold domain-containing protein [Xanthomonadales bacterium]|nr:thioredoxin fold domain-containing protein [Xanthomonadales bacterium]
MAASIYVRTALISLLVLIAQPPLYAAEREIPPVNNFAEIGHLSLQQGIPVVVFVSRDACPYCRTLRDQILKPMLAADKFAHRAILVEVSLDRVDPITGFEKGQVTAKGFGEFYGAEITPTLLFLDSEGREIGKRLIGISNLELYGHYLQKSIDEALLAIRSANLQD